MEAGRQFFNKETIDDEALAAETGGWDDPNFEERSLGTLELEPGDHLIEFFSAGKTRRSS